MSLPHDLALRDATMDDYAGIAAMREAVGWGVMPWALRAVIDQPDARCVVTVTADGSLAGIGSGIVYGPMGFIGNMIVAEAHRRRGAGSAILTAVTTYLTDAGCVRLELNATSDGRPLYERHGFQSVGTSLVARVPRDATLPPAPGITILTAVAGDLDALAAYDRPRFGGDRRQVLRWFVDGGDLSCLLAERDGQIVGYGGLGTDTGRLGPFLADEPPIAGAIMAAAFERNPDNGELRLNLPPNNRGGEAWLRSAGVALEGWDGRMARGADLQKRDETIYGMAVGALG